MLLILLASVFSLSYRKGETFSYVYESEVTTQANQGDNNQQESLTKLKCTANFKVLLASSDSTYLQMTLTNVRTIVGVNDELEEGQYDDESEAALARPIYFTQLADGSIDEISYSDEDEQDVIKSKTGVLFALRATISTQASGQFDQIEVNDPIGTHYEYFQTVTEGNKVIINSRYDTDDLIALEDDSETTSIRLDCSSTRVLIDGKIHSASSTMNVLLNPESMSVSNDEEDTISMVTEGSYTLSNFAQGNDDIFELGFSSITDAMTNRAGYKTRRFTRRIPRVREFQPMDEELDVAPRTCPSPIDLCKSYDKTWTVGNNNAGIQFQVSLMVGVQKGCKDPSRSYIAGAYVDLDILLLSNTIKAVEAYAEYGQVYGSPLRNAVELKVFGYSVYKKTFPYLDCKTHNQSLVNVNKEFAFRKTVIVYVVPIEFAAGIKLGFSASYGYELCINGLKASISLIPKATASVFGGAAASVLVAKAGIELSGTITDFLDPTAYVDGNLCKVGFYVYNNLEPITVKLIGYYQLRTIKGLKITWGKQHYVTIWSHTWASRRDKILDLTYGAK